MDVGVDLAALNRIDHVFQAQGCDSLGHWSDHVRGSERSRDRPFPQWTVLRYGYAGGWGRQVSAEEEHDPTVHPTLADVDVGLQRVRQQPGVGHGEGDGRPGRIHLRGELAL